MPINTIESDSTNKDAFGALRVSQKSTVTDSQNVIDFDTRYFFNAVIYDSASPLILAESPNAQGTGINGSFIGPLDPNSRMVPLELDSTYGSSKVIVQMKEYAPYTTAKSQLFYRSGIFSPNVNKPNEQVSITIRSSCSGSIVDRKIAQTAWNKDTLDGTRNSGNPSGILLLTENMQVFWIDAQMLYSGRVRTGFLIGGVYVVVHEENIANLQNLPTLQSYNLPPRQEINNISGSAVSRIGVFDKYNGIYLEVSDDFNAGRALTHMKCSSVLSEGVESLGGIIGCEYKTNSTTVGATLVPVLAIRPLALFNGIPNNSLISPVNLSAINTGNSDCALILVHAGDITGGAWVGAGDGASFHTYEVNSTATGITGGHYVTCTTLPKGSGSNTENASLRSLFPRIPIVYSRIDDLTIKAETLAICAVSAGNTSIGITEMGIEESRQ